MFQAERSKDVLLQEICVRFARSILDNQAKEVITGIAVAEFLAGCKIQRFAFIFREEFRWRYWKSSFFFHPTGKGSVIGNAGRMCKKMPDRHRFPRCGTVCEIPANRIVDTQSAAFLQKHNGRGGKLLGYGTESKFSLRAIRNVPFVIRHTVAFTDYRFAVAGDENGPAKAVNALHGVHVLIDL